MDNFIPDVYQKSIYVINYQKLKKSGIKCLLFDLDNTIAPIQVKRPTAKMIELFDNLKDMGFKIIIFSNNKKKRLEPFKNALEVDCSCRARKPFRKKFLKVLKEFKYNQSEVAIIGDQFLTDILGGNRVGITTILVNCISKRDIFVTKINRLVENIIIRKLQRKELFARGKYYD